MKTKDLLSDNVDTLPREMREACTVRSVDILTEKYPPLLTLFDHSLRFKNTAKYYFSD